MTVATPSIDSAVTLELTGVSCVRGGRRLFADINLAVVAGQLLRVQGANGAGKTTLLRALCGLSSPDAGQVLWCGDPLRDTRSEFHGDLIYIGHAAALKDDLSAQENLVSASLLGGDHPTVSQVRDALASAGLRNREHLPARSLSQGQRRRVALARLALQRTARLWILDEPFNALDVGATDWLVGLLANQLRLGGIVVLTSHQPVPFDASVTQVTLTL